MGQKKTGDESPIAPEAQAEMKEIVADLQSDSLERHKVAFEKLRKLNLNKFDLLHDAEKPDKPALGFIREDLKKALAGLDTKWLGYESELMIIDGYRSDYDLIHEASIDRESIMEDPSKLLGDGSIKMKAVKGEDGKLKLVFDKSTGMTRIYPSRQEVERVLLEAVGLHNYNRSEWLALVREMKNVTYPDSRLAEQCKQLEEVLAQAEDEFDDETREKMLKIMGL